MPLKLYLGCGPFPIHPQHSAIMGFKDEKSFFEEWIMVDKYVKQANTENWDALDLPVEDNSIDAIYNSHLLEHFPHPQIPSILKYWHSKLKTGGELIINVPDMAWIAKQITKLDNGYLLDGYYNTMEGEHGLQQCIYGSHAHEGEIHKAGYIESTLRKLLEDAGFKEVTIERIFEAHQMGCLLARAKK